MSKKRRVQVGDVISVPLGEYQVAALVLHVSKRFKSGMIIGFYDRLFDSGEQVDVSALGGSFFKTPNYTSTQIVTRGFWKTIGHNPELLENVEIPLLSAAYTLYYKDEVVKMLSPNELKEYPVLLGQGRKAIERRLTKHFGLKS